MIEFKIKNTFFKAEDIGLTFDYLKEDQIVQSSYSSCYFDSERAANKIQQAKNKLLESREFSLYFYKNPVPIKIYGKEYKVQTIKISAGYCHEKQAYDFNKIYVNVYSQGGHYLTSKANQVFKEELEKQNIMQKLLAVKPYIARNKLKSNLLSVNQDIKKAYAIYHQASEWLEKYQAEIDQELALII